MSLFRRLVIVLGAGGAGYQSELQKDANILSTYNLCSSVQIEELVVTLTSLATLSVSELRLTVSPSSVIAVLNYLGSLKLTASPSSVYSLATAPI